MAAHQAPLSLGFSRQEHWSGVPLLSPMHESEKWKWSRSVVSDSKRPHELEPTRLLRPWDFLGKSTGVGCHCLLRMMYSAYKLNKQGDNIQPWRTPFPIYTSINIVDQCNILQSVQTDFAPSAYTVTESKRIHIALGPDCKHVLLSSPCECEVPLILLPTGYF